MGHQAFKPAKVLQVPAQGCVFGQEAEVLGLEVSSVLVNLGLFLAAELCLVEAVEMALAVFSVGSVEKISASRIVPENLAVKAAFCGEARLVELCAIAGQGPIFLLVSPQDSDQRLDVLLCYLPTALSGPAGH
ncbi:hypothetical protein AAFN88_14890 [Pelagibius sp. CAU 1746]|uniref:hypothetical protein n=1 Tax=Pelagibius sp. CAU 1746 TaxID=3140370 RepID=UPI00325B8B2E